MVAEAVSTCKLRKYNADAKMFLAILLLNDVPMQKTLVDKKLAAKLGATPKLTPTAITPSNATPSPSPAPLASPAPSPTLTPSNAAVAADPAAPEPAPRSVSVIPKQPPVTTASSPLSMVPRSVRTPTPVAAAESATAAPSTSAAPSSTAAAPPKPVEKKIVVTTLPIGSESTHVVMNVAGVKDIAILTQTQTDLPLYSSMEETILGATEELMMKRGQFTDPKTTLQRGHAVLGLFEGQLYRAIVLAAFEDEEPGM